MRIRPRHVIRSVLAIAVTAALATAPGAASAAADQATGRATGRAAAEPAPEVRVEIPGKPGSARDEHGHAHTPAGSGYARVSPEGREGATSAPLSPAEARDDGDVNKIVDNGPTGDRLDIVVLGDGYTGGELAQFRTDAKEIWNEVAAVEPYTTYEKLFNVWTVDAVSNDSGVSGDPGKDVVRDTALGSYFWCDNIERLLCVDQRKVDVYAAKVPDADLVMVLANSTKYGGAGYNTPSPTLGYEGIATASAGEARSAQVAIHETGHSLGKLADEYFYTGTPGYEHYEGPEPGEVNISKLTAAQMGSARTKWWRWLGETSPDGGTVGAYEGGGYYVTGLNRPTDASMMRTLGKPFNLPGEEAMIAGFHRHAEPAIALTPTTRTLGREDTARISLAQPAGPDAERLKVRWYLDGEPLTARADRTAVRVADLDLSGRTGARHTLTARVTDPTDAVRDPALAKLLRTELTWRVRA